MRLWAFRLTLVALGSISTKTLADVTSASVFTFAAKRDISGKTGDPVKSVEVLADGRIFLRDGTGAVSASAQLGTVELIEFKNLLSNPRLLATPPDCFERGSDLPETEFAVDYAERSMSMRISVECPPSPELEKLDSLFDRAERTHFPGG